MKREKHEFSSPGRFLLLVVIILILSFAISWPIWRFAASETKAFSAAAGGLISLLIIYAIVRGAVKKAKARKQQPK